MAAPTAAHADDDAVDGSSSTPSAAPRTAASASTGGLRHRTFGVGIGAGSPPVDLQPCGGTHVAGTAEIGAVAVSKIENKGRQNRRITLTLVPPPSPSTAAE